MQNPETFVAILSCGLATWLLRVVPIVLVKRMTIPKWLLHFLSFVPWRFYPQFLLKVSW